LTTMRVAMPARISMGSNPSPMGSSKTVQAGRVPVRCG
jgi:hypothetical protein